MAPASTFAQTVDCHVNGADTASSLDHVTALNHAGEGTVLVLLARLMIEEVPRLKLGVRWVEVMA